MFDPTRGTFQFAEGRGAERVWSELTGAGEARVLGRLPGRSIDAAVRVTGGFLFSTPIKARAGGLYRVGPDGAEQYISARAREFRVSPRGDVVYVLLDRSDRGVVLLKRRDAPVVPLSEPEMFGEPNISADGRVVVFDHLLTGEIFACDLSSGDDRSRCQLVWADRGLFPGPGLAVSPTGDTLAYVTRGSPEDPAKGPTPAGSLQLRLLDLRTRTSRALARIDAACAPTCQVHWPSKRTIRLCPAGGSTVAEVDVESGRESVRPAGGPAGGCTLQTGTDRYELRLREAAELRFVPDLDSVPAATTD